MTDSTKSLENGSSDWCLDKEKDIKNHKSHEHQHLFLTLTVFLSQSDFKIRHSQQFLRISALLND